MENRQSAEWSARLKAFGMIIKLGNDLFEAPDFATAAGMAVNSSRTLLKFKSAALLELSNDRARVLAQHAQVSVNVHSEKAQAQVALCENLGTLDKTRILSLKDCGSLDSSAGAALTELVADGEQLMILPLAAPGFLGKLDFQLIWLLEFPGEVPPFANNAATILSRSYAEALYCHRCCRFATKAQLKRHLRPRRVILAVLVLLLALLMFVRVHESVNAEFEIKAPETVSAYAWFDGPIARCYFQDGDLVRKGDVVAEYDTSQLAFRLANAENQVSEIEQEYELESSAAFTERERLGKVRLIEARLESARVAVEEARWYMEHSRIVAPADGVLALADGRAELLINKAVRTGDRIFDVYGGEGAVAEIRVNERESSILLGEMETTLFLYTQPDRALEADITEVRPYPELTEQRIYSYVVRAHLRDDIDLRYGMRGIAKLRGERVSLGYYLFKNLVIYLRWL